MTCRRHGSKPTLALWMLVAVADVAIITATAGLVTVLFLAVALLTVGAAPLVLRQLARPEPVTVRKPVAATLSARRRI